MITSPNIAPWIGFLYLVGMTASIFSRVLMAPALSVEDSPGYIAANETQVTLAALPMNFAAGLLIIFVVFTLVSEASTILQLPVFSQEIIPAIWLIVKGFNLSEGLK